MTTLVALATKDALVMGCDSLGSMMKKMIDPFDLVRDFFDPKKNWKLRINKEGNPILKEFKDVHDKAQEIPYNQMTHVTKMFSLSPLEMGVMVTGISSIGNRTIKSLVNEFKRTDVAFNKGKSPSNYTVKTLSNRLLKFIGEYYDKEHSEKMVKPSLELMVGGYDKQKPIPTIYRIYVHKKTVESPFNGGFGIAFGGLTQEIERLVFGIDFINRIRLSLRVEELFDRYRDLLQDSLKKKGISEKLKRFTAFGNKLKLFKDWGFYEFVADWGDFSEQNAIECVNFFVEIMIKSQQFSSMLPMVGGDAHIGLITKEDGFRFISREEYEHEGYKIPK